MRKIFTKILCFTAAATAAIGVLSVSACSNVNTGKPLDYVSTTDKAVSNGGFAVEKGDYVYYINGKQDYTADNSFGKVEKGAIMRISKGDLAARNYEKAQTVVPQMAYSGNSNAGIFIYGDYVYYSTPSTELNSDGEVQNSYIAFKSAKLDGTEVMKEDYYAQYSNNAVEYRFVEVDDTVYLVYVATSEDLYGTSYTNIHSVNTKTGVNTLLAYNVDGVMFDKEDVTNPRIYYTMKVTDFVLGTTSSNYNQVWTVTADATVPADYSKYFEENVEDYDPEKDPKYVNCGTLVFDGIGKVEGMTESVTPFNSQEKGVESVERSAYTYSLSSYENGTLFYTRTSTQNDSAMLFAAKESAFFTDNWQPVLHNAYYKAALMSNCTSATSFTYLYDDNGNVDEVIIAESAGLVKAAVMTDEDGYDKIFTGTYDRENRYYMTTDGQATVLFVDKEDNYIYYSLTGGNGYTVYRVNYGGDYYNYNGLPEKNEVTEYTPVRVLDLDSTSDWYKPELLEGQILFPSETRNMSDYSYIMVCDLRARENGEATSKLMTNKQIGELNDRYNGVAEKINEIDETLYANLKNALNYVYYENDSQYIDTLIKMYADIKDYDEEKNGAKYTLSDASLDIVKDFLEAKKDWSEYSATAADIIKVNGKDVAANKRDYYYALLGVMNEEDAEAYENALRTTYLQGEPEIEQTWFESLSTGAKVGFIIGVCAGGLIVIAAGVIVTLVIIRKRKNKMPVYKKKRIKVDTTDDKNINVYEDEQ